MAAFKSLAAVSSVGPSSERKADARDVGFETLYGGQFTLSTQWIILNYPVILFHWHSTTVSVEMYPFTPKFTLESLFNDGLAKVYIGKILWLLSINHWNKLYMQN